MTSEVYKKSIDKQPANRQTRKADSKAKPYLLCRIIGLLGLPLLLLGIWQLGAEYYNQPWIFPPATAVLRQLVNPLKDHYASGSLLWNTYVSLIRVIIGFLSAAVIGIVMGLVMGACDNICKIFEPTLELIRPLCPIAWLPFAIVLFKLRTVPQAIGLGYTNTVLDQIQLGMVFVIFVGAFFPILTNTIDGVRGVRENYIILAKMLGAGKADRFIHVYLPAALPSIITGLRLGIGLAWFVIIAAEMMTGTNSGIGYLLIYAADNAAMDLVIACMVIIACIGACLNYTMILAKAKLAPWHGKEL